MYVFSLWSTTEVIWSTSQQRNNRLVGATPTPIKKVLLSEHTIEWITSSVIRRQIVPHSSPKFPPEHLSQYAQCHRIPCVSLPVDLPHSGSLQYLNSLTRAAFGLIAANTLVNVYAVITAHSVWKQQRPHKDTLIMKNEALEWITSMRLCVL